MAAGTLILAGLGIWLLTEGLLGALAPDVVKRLSRLLSELPAGQIAVGGLGAAAIGACLLFLAVRLA